MERHCQHSCPITTLLQMELRDLKRAVITRRAQAQACVDLSAVAFTALLRVRDAAIIAAAD